MREFKSLLLQASFLGLVAAPSSVLAQQVEAQPTTVGDDSAILGEGDEPVSDADGTVAEEGEAIVVTGSRIRRRNFDAFEPTVTVDEKYLDERNLTNIADALNESPIFRGSVTPNGAQGGFGQGVNFVNGFGLGSNRTLTLVNGRRFVSSNAPTLFSQGAAGTQVDLNVFPSILTDRIDSISVGGAPIYGSDAISGTVNIIQKTRLEGIEVNGTSAITEEGDNFRYNVAIAGGLNFADDRGNITGAYTRERVKGVLSNSRSFLRDNFGNATNPSSAQAAALGRGAGITFVNDGRLNTALGFNDSTSDGFPGNVVVRDLTISFLTGGGIITQAAGAAGSSAAANAALNGRVARNFQFDPSGNVVPFNRGIPFVGINSSGGDGFRFNDFSQITSDVDRDIFNGFATYEFSEALQFFAEGTYYKAGGDELVQQPTFNSSLFGGASGALTFDVTSPFLTEQARATLIANGVNSFQVSRASLDLVDVTGSSDLDLYRGVAGFRGDLTLAGREFNYEVSGNYGRTKVKDNGTDINRQNFINAVNVTRNAAGQIVCTTTPTRLAGGGGSPIADPNCVPLNLLGLGVSSQAARDYVTDEFVTRTSLEQIVFNANVGAASLFTLFGNDVGFNVGYEHRQEKGSFNPSDFQQQGLGRSVAILPVSGKYNVDEVFGEVVIPLISPNNELSFVNKLEIFGRGRYVDNTVNGGFFAYSAGGAFAPIRDIEFRGNYTKSFRAPAITELFQPSANFFAQVLDLCTPAARGAGPVPDIRRRNCEAFLAAFPNATPLDAASATVPARSGGNDQLENEVARSFTYGVIVRPRFIPGLTFSADYIRIKISDPIANLSVADINNACFDNADFNLADPANGNAFCSRIGRNAAGTGMAANGGDGGGQVIANPASPAVVAGFVNGNIVNFNGIQGSVDYRRTLAGLGLPGSFEVTGDLLYNRRKTFDITGVAPVRTDGTLNDPEFAGQVNLRYINDDFGFNTSINYIGERLFTRVSRGPDFREFDQLKDFVLINAGAYVDAGDDFRLSLAVTNLFNRRGEKFNGVLLPASFNNLGGDLFGRRYSASARINF